MAINKKLIDSISGGTAVAAIGLSQVLAVGALSFIPLGPAALASGVVGAFITATLGSLCVALVSRAPGEISGPRTSISVIYAALCADLVMRAGPGLVVGEVVAALSVAVMLMGVLQVLAGWARLGEAMKFLPYPVNAGFVTGTGLLVVWSQVGPLLGLEARLSTYDWHSLIQHAKPLALATGVVTAAAVWLMPRFTKRVQPLLAGLVIGAIFYHLLALVTGSDVLGPTLGTLTPATLAVQNFEAAWGRAGVPWLLETALYVLPYSGFLALQGIMNAALTSTAVAEITGVRPRVNRALVAQGCGNILCGLLAALPIGPSPSQSMVAAKMKGISSIVPGGSAVILFAAVLAFGAVLAHVPMVVLAGLLVTSGFGLIDRWTRDLVARVVRRHDLQREIKWNLAIVTAVATAFFFGSVPLALLVGTVLATLLLAVSLSSATKFISQDGPMLCSARVWPDEQARWLSEARSAVRVFRPRGGLFFGTAEQLAGMLAALDKSVRYCVVDCSDLTVLDATGCQIISANTRKLAARGTTVIIAGLDPDNPRDRTLIALGLDFPSAKDRWFRDLDHALEWVECELLRERWPEIAQDEPADLSKTHFAKGLTEDEVGVLRSMLSQLDRDEGTVLFKRGAAGSSIYLIDRGQIDIRVVRTNAESGWRRMAALGPGSVFGEVAMLTQGQRSADAVCVKPTRLLELTHESLLALGRQFPAIYAKIIVNLSAHLATRLMAATDIARGR